MVLTVSFELFPVIGLSCHRHRRDAEHRRQLDASVEASEPHDFTVRIERRSPSTPTRPPHSEPNVRDDGDTPLLWGSERHVLKFDLGEMKNELFFRSGLDR
jgi:hypothetical protein